MDERDIRYIEGFENKLVYHENAGIGAEGFDAAYHSFHAQCARKNIIKIKAGKLEELLNA